MIKRNFLVPFISMAVLVVVTSACGSVEENTQEGSAEDAITVYTSRDSDVDKDIFSAFTEETGIEVNVTSGSDEE
ncbi:hypothetical protein D7Z54_34635, partial [Salibacterium salarium]